MKGKAGYPWMKVITFGQLSLALLILCLISGIFLVVPYDINNPFSSITYLVLINPGASLLRNIHYWSAQFFLLFMMLHMADHMMRKKAIRLKAGMWLRLTIGVLVAFLAMITGFILKGDADAMQARQIYDSLLSLVPVVGQQLASTFSGSEASLQLIYVHHLATFTLLLLVVVLEHIPSAWPRAEAMVPAGIFILVISLFIMAPLHDGLSLVVKGPWYFVGFQELLHLLTHPGWGLVLVFLLLLLIALVPFTPRRGFVARRSLMVLAIIYALLTITGYFFRGPGWQWQWPWSQEAEVIYNPISSAGNQMTGLFEAPPDTLPVQVMGRYEGCLSCHGGMTGFSPSHNPEATGCYSCHGGNPFTVDKHQAHRGMLTIPGNLADASHSCGTTGCHPEITTRIHTSLMTTLSGMISVDRFVFGEETHPDVMTNVHELGDSPADEHLRNMCVRCHLGNPKTSTGPVNESSRGGGCLACHLNYPEHSGYNPAYPDQPRADSLRLTIHPSLDLRVSNDHCFGCHSRSGRISTNYEGWHETTMEADDMVHDTMHRLVEGSRVFRRMPDDIHHSKGMDCIDCHGSYELMGDGTFHAHQEDQEQVACSDCHLNLPVEGIPGSALDRESALIASLRYPGSSGRTYLTSKKQGRPLINTSVEGDSLWLTGKNNGKRYPLIPPAEACTRGTAHDDLSCSACHSAWAPSCIGCHNAYEADAPGYNMILQQEKTGSWVEYIGLYNAHPPALGRRVRDSVTRIIPVVPGMVLTIDLGSFDKSLHDSLLFRRLFAPAAPHTTSAKGRTCVSCHLDPVALGYGRGSLTLAETAQGYHWKFTPYYQSNENDGLPEDAWIPFLKDRSGETVSTRSDVFPLSVNQQRRMLTAGACLTCHHEESEVMKATLYQMDSVIQMRTPACIVPYWP